MKKVMVGFLVAGFLAGGHGAFAEGKGLPVEYSLSLGAQSNARGDSPFSLLMLSLDARAGIRVLNWLEISPEVMAVADDNLRFAFVWVYPGALVNLRLGDFFVGAGAILPIVFMEGGSATGSIVTKANVGYRRGRLILTVFAMSSTEEGFSPLAFDWVGATVGVRF